MMRKITEDAARSFKEGRKFRRDNTEVCVRRGWVFMYLHGNLIASRQLVNPQHLQLTLAGWGTPTTRERLNGILSAYDISGMFHQHKHKLMFYDEIISSKHVLVFDKWTKQRVKELEEQCI